MDFQHLDKKEDEKMPRELNLLQECEEKTILINGVEFPILLSDDDLFKIPHEYAKVYKETDFTNLDDIVKISEFMDSLFDRTLGAGALKKISGGKPVMFADKSKWYKIIYDEIFDIYGKALAARYE